MDGHIRWLRRYVLWRALQRLAIECSVVTAAAFGAGLIIDQPPLLALLTAVVTAQIYGLIRVVVTLLSGPINLRYLQAWRDGSQDLVVIEPSAIDDRVLESQLTESDFEHRCTYGVRSAQGEPMLETYLSGSGLILAAVDVDDQAVTLLSQLGDDRLLTTSTEAMPSTNKLVANHLSKASLPELLADHVRCVRAMVDSGVAITPIRPDAAVRQLHLEWDGWSMVGPFVGSLIGIDQPGLPLALQVKLPAGRLVERCLGDQSEGAAPTDRPEDRATTAVPEVGVAAAVPERRPPAEPAVRHPPGPPPEWTTRRRKPTTQVGS